VTFNAIETSNEDGKIIGLYAFRLGGKNWYYTSADRDITYNTKTYVKLAISDSGVSQGGETANETFTVTTPASEVTSLFTALPPAEDLWLTKREMHYGDTEAPVVWIGTVSSRKQLTGASYELNCQTIGPTFARSGKRLLWQRGCPHFLYGPDCRLDKADFAQPATVTAVNGLTITLDGITTDGSDFDGGFIEWDIGDDTFERRGLQVGGAGSNIVCLTSAYGLEVDQEVIVYPGCNLTMPRCNDRFDNAANFGGNNHMIQKTPFSGSVLF
jgi:uncharacterized phage protein (TIGR02218 family)